MCELCNKEMLHCEYEYDKATVELMNNNLIFNVHIQTLEWNEYNDDYVAYDFDFTFKINFCPICGRELKG